MSQALPLFPVYLYEDDFTPPETGTYYLVTKTGIYLKKQTKAGDALVKVTGIPWLKEPEIDFRLKLPKIPGRIIGQALTFFREIFKKHRSEAYVTLLYSEKLREYRLWCPKQKVSAGSVNYDRTDQPSFEDRAENNWAMVGTIHSHCDFSAFHSGTDTHDESTFDGIHITLGHVNKDQFSVASSVAINDQRETLDPENCCLGVVKVGDNNVSSSKYMTWGKTQYFELELTDEDWKALDGEDTEVILNEWMGKVEYVGYSGFFGKGGGKSAADDKDYDKDYDSQDYMGRRGGYYNSMGQWFSLDGGEED